MSLSGKSKGCGIGLRTPHYPLITSTWPAMDWFEAVSENYMDTGGRPLKILEQVRHHYPVALHGTALSIGSTDPLSEKYLERLKRLVDHIDPFIVSDHLCWSGVKGRQLHDLLPLPFNEEALRHVVERVSRVQEFLNRKILLENVSTYVTYKHSTMTEWEFLVEVARRSGCGILLDINNVFVNAVNHQFDPMEYLRHVPGELVGQIHLAGHTDMGDFLFDTHSMPILEKVWDLYRRALSLYGPVSTLIEWDENIPPFEHLSELASKARAIHREFESKNPDTKAVTARALARPVESSGPVISLKEVQEKFSERMKPHAEMMPALDTFLNPQGAAKGSERLQVYANGYTARLREALGQVYEAARKALGEDGFDSLAHVYAETFPSTDYNLNFLGRQVPELLETSPFIETMPYLPDLARLEWKIWEAFNAFDGPPLAPETMSAMTPEQWEGAGFIFQPSVSLFSSDWPVLDLWLGRQKEGRGFFQNVAEKSQRVLIGRKADQVRCELLDENQHRMLEGLLAGKSLGDICGELAETMGEDQTLPIADWFSRWMRDGLIRERVGEKNIFLIKTI
jgi:uncharacterized protein (UPF0276 family)